ncbi:MAG TPA: hypothetical protein VGF29_04005 [Hyphomicrobiaceae bacterium]
MRRVTVKAFDKALAGIATGQCLCGKVRVEISIPAFWAWHDHSRASRRAHGAAYATYVRSTTPSMSSPESAQSAGMPRPSDGCKRRRWWSRPEADRALHAHRPARRPGHAKLTAPSAIMKQPHEMRPGNRYARHAQARRTLGDLIASKSALVAICQPCRHRRLLFPAVLANRLGENILVVDLPQHLRCAECKRHGTAKVYESTR